ncbi:MAG: polysaccharide pyruvyl transferase family protein [Elusimicrobia bacterium]|nr:polysaccharide pyruvyl transferase family protein [Elusimicrobiota bacterium]
MAAFNKIVLSGYYGYSNIGDELILSNILKGFRQYLPDTEIVVLNRRASKSGTCNTSFINRYNPLSILYHLLTSRALMMGGGSLIQDRSGFFTIYYYFVLMAAAKILLKKIIIFNQGIGPIKNPFNRFIAKIIFRNTDFIAVRDTYSEKYISRITGSSEGIILGADPVFMDISDHGYRKKSELKMAGLTVRKWKKHRIKEKFSDIVRRLGETGIKCRNIQFQCNRDKIDIPGAEEIACRNPRDIWDNIGKMDILIGMRVHSLMAGALMGMPLIGVNYDPKVRAFCEFMNIPCFELDDMDVSRVVAESRKIHQGHADYRVNIEALNRRLIKSWELLKRELDDGSIRGSN